MGSFPTRKPNRLAGYDYRQPGCYFITICVKNHRSILCRGAQCAPVWELPPLTEIGRITEQAIQSIHHHYPHVLVDKYVIMPNHIHFILRIEDSGRTLCAPTPIVSVPRIIKAMKEVVTKRAGFPVWQKGYHDHIIRNEADYLRIWDYIQTNPAKWREDCYFTETEE